MNDIIWERWNCGDYVGPEQMYRICGQNREKLSEFYNKLLPIYNFDLEDISFYEKRIKCLTYDKKSQISYMNERFLEKELPSNLIPWDLNGINGKHKLKDLQYRILPEFFSPSEIISIPMWIKFNYLSKKEISNSCIKYSWKKFIKKILKIKLSAKNIGKEEYFKTTLNFSDEIDEINRSKLIEDMPYGRFAKDSLFDFPITYNNFIENKNLPIFMELGFDYENEGNKIELIQKSGFNEILINHMYFSNSPMDVIIGGRFVEHNSIGNVSLETLESLEGYIFKTLKLCKEQYNLNIFLNKSDQIGWLMGKYPYQDKSYHIENIQIVKIKNNYYEDYIYELELWNKIYHIIIDFQFEDSSLSEYKHLLDKIVFSTI